jgi:predicted TIM-barrel fold metal-dependent hydrolase
MAMIDTNVWLGRWPFRRLPAEDAATLAERLRRNQIEFAWVGSLEGLFHRDVAGVNARLADECRTGDGRLFPFGTVNPTLPDWEEDLRRCSDLHRFRGIRLAPTYHGYALDDPSFVRLLRLAARRKLIVQLVVGMEDDRTQNPVFRVPGLDLKPLERTLQSMDGHVSLVILNAFRSMTVDQARGLAVAGDIFYEIATLEGVDRVASLVDRVGPDRVLFGSHYPLFHLQSAALKLRETKLDPRILAQIGRENAVKLWSG